jgi:hypothetical protein
MTFCSYGFLRRVDSSVDANVSEKQSVSNFRAEDGDGTKTQKNIIILTVVKT